MVDFIPPLTPGQAPAPLSPTVPLNPPMVGTASPFHHVDGQNRDLILEAIRTWARGPFLEWVGLWRQYLIDWSQGNADWLNTWSDAVVAYVTAELAEQTEAVDLEIASLRSDVADAVQQVINSTIEITAPVIRSVMRSSARELGTIGANPAPEDTDDHAYLQTLIDSAAAAGVARVTINPRNPADDTEPWVIDGPLALPAGITIDATAAIIEQTVYDEPAFLIPPGADGVTLNAGVVRLGGARPAYADLSTTPAYGGPGVITCSGVLGFANNTTITGEFAGFRNAVRLASWDGASGLDGLKNHNRVDITVGEVDFGLVYFAQSGLDATVKGRYLGMAGTPDAAHLIYATLANDLTSTGCHVNGEAWDSNGYMCGSAFQLRTQHNLTSDYLKATDCPGVLTIESARGPHTITQVVGSRLTGVVNRPELGNLQAAGIRTGIDPNDSLNVAYGQTTIVDAVIDLVSTSASYTRAVSITAPDTNIGELHVTMNLDAMASGSYVVSINAARSTLGAVDIRNAGIGGTSGINYSGGIGHRLAIAPRMVGVLTGINVAATVTGELTVDHSLIDTTRDTDPVIAGAGAAAVTIRGGKPRRNNTWYAVTVGAAATATLTDGFLYFIPWRVDRELRVVNLALNVTAAASGGTIRVGLYRDDQYNNPAALVTTFGAVTTDTTGVKTVTGAATIAPGDYFLGVVVQGASGVALAGHAASSVDGRAGNATDALAGASIHQSAVTGTLPATAGTVGYSSAAVPRVAYQLWNPSS